MTQQRITVREQRELPGGLVVEMHAEWILRLTAILKGFFDLRCVKEGTGRGLNDGNGIREVWIMTNGSNNGANDALRRFLENHPDVAFVPKPSSRDEAASDCRG